MNPFSRTELLLGQPAMEKLNRARVAVFGLGGVGGYVVEALARSGIGALDLIDSVTAEVKAGRLTHTEIYDRDCFSLLCIRPL